MAHYAFLDENNIVTEVITGRDEDEVVEGVSDWEAHYSAIRGQRCLRTSYNTKYNEHIDGGVAFRGNYAGVGFLYLDDEDIFVASFTVAFAMCWCERGVWVSCDEMVCFYAVPELECLIA